MNPLKIKSKRSFIPYGKQTLSKAEEREVISVLRSDRITQGPVIGQFEKQVAKTVKAKYAVAVSNGTAALHLACLSLGLKKGDEVITTPISFLASSNAILYAGAKPVFADIDPFTHCLDPKDVKKKVTRKTKAILTVDMSGHPSPLNELKRICRQYKLILIQDASHSLGARYYGKPVGGLADLTTFSFHPVKSITTGEGGMITTSQKNLYHTLIQLRNHGINRDPKQFLNRSFRNGQGGPWLYEMQRLGFNYRITDIQCALGVVQLRKLKTFVSKRTKIVQKYRSRLKGLDWLTIPSTSKHVHSAWHLFTVQINFKKIGKTRAQVFNLFKKAGIGVQVHYIPIYKQPFYQKMGLGRAHCPQAETYYQHCLSLPIYPLMTASDINRVVSTLKALNS